MSGWAPANSLSCNGLPPFDAVCVDKTTDDGADAMPASFAAGPTARLWSHWLSWKQFCGAQDSDLFIFSNLRRLLRNLNAESQGAR